MLRGQTQKRGGAGDTESPPPPIEHIHVEMEPLAVSYIAQIYIAYHQHFVSARPAAIFLS